MNKGETLKIIVYTPQKYIFVNTTYNCNKCNYRSSPMAFSNHKYKRKKNNIEEHNTDNFRYEQLSVAYIGATLAIKKENETELT